ncbi:MAG TPA: ABC transporter substrate-binding protein [Gammaproteobacteria bacterium]|nr:ABC transporter substrate-binding protein [Gammaproteobacteria bacterium]
MRLRIGGVPEHFNLPWRRLLDSGPLAREGVDASWEDYPGGSGAMREALQAGRLDLGVLLTEGAVAGIANGGAFRIVSVYTESPLLWGVHVPAGSAFRALDDVRGARYAISRFGSGSHLMAFALAQQRGWPFDELRFVAVDDLDGAVRAFERRTADVFLWEKFMTKPLVDSGRFRRVGEFGAPWPAFVVAASDSALATMSDAIARVLAAVLDAAAKFRADPGAAAEISRRFGLTQGDAAEWLQRTQWAGRVGFEAEALERAAALLQAAGLVPAGRIAPLTEELGSA